MKTYQAGLLSLALLAGVVSGYGSVSFQNTGTIQGWSNYPQNPSRGTIGNVSSPVYKGSTAIRFFQEFTTIGSYHNEVVLTPTAPVGSDSYFGFAIYLPSSWVYSQQSFTFSQWARSDSSNTPWTLLFLRNQELRTGGSGGLAHSWFTGFPRGVWHRFVIRIRNSTTQGRFELWFNGTYMGRVGGDSITPGGPSIRWSSGQYNNNWRTDIPDNSPTISYMDHFRVATSYAEAEPDNWNETGGGSFSGRYRIVARHSGRAAVVQGASLDNGANVFQYSYTSGDPKNDEWDLIDVGSGYYRVMNAHSGKAMVVQGASTANGANVIQWTYNDNATRNDEWSIEDVGGGYHRFINRQSGKALEVIGGGSGNSVNIQQNSWNGGTHQQFQVIKL